MIGQQGNLLQEALSSGQLTKFLVGDAPFFYEAKVDNPEPQNVQQAFDLQIVRYWALVRPSDFPGKFVKGLVDLLDTYPDRDKAIYVVHKWIYTYFAALSKKRKEAPLGIYSELFEVDMRPVAGRMRELLEANQRNLTADTRWAGATWNSTTGLWGPILRTATVVRDKLGGPDYLPGSA